MMEITKFANGVLFLIIIKQKKTVALFELRISHPEKQQVTPGKIFYAHKFLSFRPEFQSL